MSVIASLWELLRAPFVQPSLLWQILPILLLWIMLELYFGTHKDEHMGWNSALGHGISVFWIAMSLLQYLFEEGRMGPDLIFALILAVYSIVVSWIAFSHKLPAGITYRLASPEVLFYGSIIAILHAHQVIVFSASMLSAIGILFVLIVLLLWLLRSLLPESHPSFE